ncbi:hypothetical protein HDU81_009633 [Chytriomyces hyalinus]|nr:hypothetical protein HDU81_009633 [Chytriomyces hyalinus]
MMADFNEWFDEIVGNGDGVEAKDLGGIRAGDWEALNAVFREVLGGEMDNAVPEAQVVQPNIAIEDLDIGDEDFPELNFLLDDFLATMY